MDLSLRESRARISGVVSTSVMVFDMSGEKSNNSESSSQPIFSKARCMVIPLRRAEALPVPVITTFFPLLGVVRARLGIAAEMLGMAGGVSTTRCLMLACQRSQPISKNSPTSRPILKLERSQFPKLGLSGSDVLDGGSI